MKKILVIHNRYQITGGEDIAVENEIKFLQKQYNVKVLYFENTINSFFQQVFYFIFNNNYQSYKKIKNFIEEFNPDYIYINNTWFKISLSVFKLLESKKIKPILKLHNLRYYCTSTYSINVHLNGNQICPACGLKKKRFSLFNKYFQESYLKSLLVLRYGKKYINILINNDLEILVLSKFHKDSLIKSGVPKEKISIYPNYLSPSKTNTRINSEKFIVYAGRVSEEKGVGELISSFLDSNISDWSLKIIGEGPALKELKNRFNQNNVKFMGSLTNKETLGIINKSSGIVTATKLLEGQPTLLCEASMLGKVSVFPNVGGMLEFFPDNYAYTYRQYDYEDLIKKMNLFTNTELVLEQGIENKTYITNFLSQRKLSENFEKILNETRE
jgi:glycosyltransferase involved in cell wall biosynthesis